MKKRFFSLALAAILVLPLFAFSANATEPELSLDRTKLITTNVGFIIYADNTAADGSTVNNLAVTHTNTTVSPYSTENGYYTKLTPADTMCFLRINQMPFKAGTAANEPHYLSIRYMIIGADAEYQNQVVSAPLRSSTSGKEVNVPYTVKNNVWQTVTVDVNNGASWNTGARISAISNQGEKMDILFPILNKGHYIVLDYVGFFVSENAANTQSQKAADDYALLYPTVSPVSANVSVDRSTFSESGADRAYVYYFDNVKNGEWTSSNGRAYAKVDGVRYKNGMSDVGTLSATTPEYGLRLTTDVTGFTRILFSPDTLANGVADTFYVSIRFRVNNPVAPSVGLVRVINKTSGGEIINLTESGAVATTGDWQTLTLKVGDIRSASGGNFCFLNHTLSMEFMDANLVGATIDVDYLAFFNSEALANAEAAKQDANWKAIEAKNIVDLYGVQFAEGAVADTAKLRLVGSVKAEDLDAYEGVGFEVTAVYAGGTKTFVTPAGKQGLVYSSILADGETLNAETGSYFFTLSITDIPTALTDISVTVKPFYVENGEKVTSAVNYSFRYDASANNFV